jgi:hypothetical protein
VCVRVRDRVLERLEKLLSAPGVVRDDRAHAGCVENRPNRVVGRPLAVRGDELERHDLDVPVHARDADSVVSPGADRPRDVRPVTVVVGRVVVVVDEIPTMDVVDVAVAVVVDPVRGAARAGFAGVRPDVRGEVGMVPVHT